MTAIQNNMKQAYRQPKTFRAKATVKYAVRNTPENPSKPDRMTAKLVNGVMFPKPIVKNVAIL